MRTNFEEVILCSSTFSEQRLALDFKSLLNIVYNMLTIMGATFSEFLLQNMLRFVSHYNKGTSRLYGSFKGKGIILLRAKNYEVFVEYKTLHREKKT